MCLPEPRGIRRLSLALAVVPWVAWAGPVPGRVMSINLCSDALVLDLLPPSRIASVTFLARRSTDPALVAQAARVAQNHGTAEEILAQRPDLVIAGEYTTPAVRRLLKLVRIPLVELSPAEDFAQIRAVTRRVAAAVGEALLRPMDATLAGLARTAPHPAVTIAGWDGAGAVPGRGTLFDAIVTAAGAVNLAAPAGGRYGRFDAEQLLTAHPDLLAYGDAATRHPALQAQRLQNPAIRRAYAGRQIVYPELLYSCGLPRSAEAAAQMRARMRDALGEPKS